MRKFCKALGFILAITGCGNLNTGNHQKKAFAPASLNADAMSRVNAIPGEKVARNDGLGSTSLQPNCCGRAEYAYNALSTYCEYMGDITCKTPTPNRCAYKAPQACLDKTKAAVDAIGTLTPDCQQAVDKRHQLMAMFYDSKPCDSDSDCSVYTETYTACPQAKAISNQTFRTLASRDEISLSTEVMRVCLGSDRTCAGDAGAKATCQKGVCALSH